MTAPTDTPEALAELCKREARHLFDLAPDAEDMAHLSMAIDRLASLAASAASLVAEPESIGTQIAKAEFAKRWDEAAIRRDMVNDAVTPEFLLWLQEQAPREGVASNVAWNAGVTWACSLRQATAPLPASPAQPVVAADPYAWRWRCLINKHVTGAPRLGEIQVGEWWGSMSDWMVDRDTLAKTYRIGFEREPLYLTAPKVEAPVARVEGEALTEGCFEVWYEQHTGKQPTLASSRYYALTKEASIAKAAWDAATSRAGGTGVQAMPVSRDEIIGLISSISNNSADHDIAFAYRVLDAAKAEPPASGLRAETDAGGEVL